MNSHLRKQLASKPLMAALGFAAFLWLSCVPSALAQTVVTPSGTAKPADTLAIKSLKYVTLSADSALWSVKDDSVDSDGDTNFDLKFVDQKNYLTVNISEYTEDTRRARAEATLRSVLKKIREADVGSQPIDSPKEYVPMAESMCGGVASSPTSGGAILKLIICIKLEKGYWYSSTISYFDELSANEIQAVNTVVKSVSLKK
jgi:hypothetical protein